MVEKFTSNFLKTPIPLVAPVAAKFVIASCVLPKAADDPYLVSLLEESCHKVRNFSSKLEEFKENLPGLLNEIFPDLDTQTIDQKDSLQQIRFQCRCSRERSINALSLLGSNEIESMIKEEGQAELRCNFCNTFYIVGKEELKQLIKNNELV